MTLSKYNVKFKVLFLAILSVFYLCSFSDVEENMAETDFDLYEEILETYNKADNVYVGEVYDYRYLTTTYILVLQTKVRDVYKGDYGVGEKTAFAITSNASLREKGGDDGAMFLVLSRIEKINNSDSFVVILRIEKDKSLTFVDDYNIKKIGSIEYDVLVNQISGGEHEDLLFKTDIRPYFACFVIGLAVMTVCVLWKYGMIIDKIITFFVSLFILFINSVSTETAGFYFYFDTVDWVNVIYSTVSPLIILTIINIVVSLAVKKVMNILKNKRSAKTETYEGEIACRDGSEQQ